MKNILKSIGLLALIVFSFFYTDKVMNVVNPLITMGCLALTSYVVLKNKKNMLDVIIEEIETMK